MLDDESAPVSANLCEALVEMMPADESTDLESIEQLAQRLRPKQGSTLAQFVGKVIELAGSPSQSNELEGDVMLQLQVDDQLVKVRVPLSADDYRHAGLAHFEQRFVSIMGQLRRRGPRSHVLEQPRAFAVLPRESAQT